MKDIDPDDDFQNGSGPDTQQQRLSWMWTSPTLQYKFRFRIVTMPLSMKQ